MKSFIRPLTEKQKQLKELRYNLYLLRDQQNIGITIQDVNDKRTTLLLNKEEEKQEDIYFELKSCLEGIRWILENHPEDIRKNIQIRIWSNSVYCVNVIREWREKWNKTNFENRPNKQLLQSLEKYSNICNITAKWSNEQLNEITHTLYDHIKG